VTTRSTLAVLGTFFGVALLAACGGTQRESRSVNPATLHVRQEWVGDALYVEGSYSYLRVENDEKTVAEVRLKGMRTPEATLRLDPGAYRLVSFQRPCDGNCGVLDPPTDQCGGEIDAKAGGHVEATLRLSPGDGCTIAADS
jgi:hypothetical protein